MEKSSREKLFTQVKQNRKIFVETGTYRGQGVEAAIKCKYERIISFEIDTETQELNKIKFKNNDNIILITGSSADDCFKNEISKLEEDAVFWLDAHQMHKGFVECPIYDELLVICESEYNHIILIDDVRNFSKPCFNTSVEAILDFISKHNRKYKTWFGEVRDYKDDVLVIEFIN